MSCSLLQLPKLILLLNIDQITNPNIFISESDMMGRTRKPVKYVVVDAFTDCEFKGNPAAVCLLEEEREDEWLQSVAAEYNFSETCYLKPIPVLDSPHPRFHLRWFAPTNEVEICGHATLAAAHFCFTSGLVKANTIEFSTLSGLLTAQKVSELNGSISCESENSEKNQVSLIELNFPAAATSDCSIEETALLSKVFIHETVIDMKKTDINYLFVVLPSSKAVIDACLDFEEIKKCPGNGLIISAAAPFGSGFDIVSRFFAPEVDVNEDPVCGSAHCALAVYWSKKLGKTDLVAYAASRRGGILKLHWDEQSNRVKIQGHAVTVMEGSIVV